MPMPHPERTHFLPSQRLDQSSIQEQSLVAKRSEITAILNSVPTPILILNSHRQIILHNKLFGEAYAQNNESMLGLRPGEALGCDKVKGAPGGCGTSESCRQCGAALTLLEDLQDKSATQEVRINRIANGRMEALDMRVTSRPIELSNRRYTVFTLVDISHEKRRRALERVFFHDIMNTVGGLYGLSSLLLEEAPEELVSDARTINTFLGQMRDEIGAQKDLLAAESGELTPEFQLVDAESLLQQVMHLFQKKAIELSLCIEILEDGSQLPPHFTSDPVLLARVLINLTKNALEASLPGQTVTLSCSCTDETVQFSVHNESEMRPDAKLQVFQRSFSTKGTGRGLGTYSVKLLTEQYLKGSVSFTSDQKHGTTFVVELPRG